MFAAGKAAFCSAAFSPLSLFAAGQKGLWWDASDMATLWQNAGRTTPVTASGQTIAVIDDKSGNGNHGTVASGGTWQIDGGGRGYIEVPSGGVASPAITGWSAEQAVAVAFQANTAAQHIIVNRGASTNRFIGWRNSAGGSGATYSFSGTPATLVNGAIIMPDTQSALHTAVGSGVPVVEESFKTDMTIGNLWDKFTFGGYGSGFSFAGRLYGALAYIPSTATEIANTRTWLAGKCGAAPSAYAGAIGYVAGDSTSANFGGQNEVLAAYVTATCVKSSLAVSGETILQQQARVEANLSRAYARWYVIMLGLNDLANYTDGAAAILARLQGLVTSIRSKSAVSKIVVAQMTPARQRWVDLFGATNGAICQQVWLDVNAGIAGGGATPITGADAIVTSHVAALGDGTGALAAGYDLGDHIHENNAARAIVGAAWSTTLTGLGVL